MNGLGEQIAVLDGITALDPNDGRIGQQRPSVDQYARLIAPNVLVKTNMPSTDGALYGGGSNYYRGGALMPSTVGLAGLRGLRGLRDVPNVLPTRYNVISPSGGVNYGGGSSYAKRLPLLPSNAGLAAMLIDGGYGRAGLGAAMINNGYGRAGLGGTGTAADEDLAAAAEAVAVAIKLDPTDGRIGQYAARVDEYGRPIAQGVLERSDVIDPSEGGNYGGGSNYYARGPLTPSNSGLAGLSGCGCNLGALPKTAMRGHLSAHYTKLKSLASALLMRAKSKTLTPAERAAAQKNANAVLLSLCKLRVSLRMPLTAACVKRLKSAQASAPKMRNVADFIEPVASGWR